MVYNTFEYVYSVCRDDPRWFPVNPLGPLGYECAQHRRTPRPSVDGTRSKALHPFGSQQRRGVCLGGFTRKGPMSRHMSWGLNHKRQIRAGTKHHCPNASVFGACLGLLGLTTVRGGERKVGPRVGTGVCCLVLFWICLDPGGIQGYLTYENAPP